MTLKNQTVLFSALLGRFTTPLLSVTSNLRYGINMKLEAVTLEGKSVRLEPLSQKHTVGLCEAIADGELWNLFFTLVPHTEQVPAFILKAQQDFEVGESLVFAIIDKSSNEIAGSTRYMRVSLPHKRAEIGWTFLGKHWQQTNMNTEVKSLLLRHAFETLDLNRVEFITDYLNERSNKALRRIGAKQEGIMNQHMVMPDGRVRDSVLYSITRNAWPGIKQHLKFKLEHH